MPDLRTDERRPADHEAPSQVLDPTTASLADPDGVRQDDDTSLTLTDREVREAIEDVLAAVVVTADAAGGVRRRTFLTLAAAQRSARRAEAAGRPAVVALVRLQLVASVGGASDA